MKRSVAGVFIFIAVLFFTTGGVAFAEEEVQKSQEKAGLDAGDEIGPGKADGYGRERSFESRSKKVEKKSVKKSYRARFAGKSEDEKAIARQNRKEELARKRAEKKARLEKKQRERAEKKARFEAKKTERKKKKVERRARLKTKKAERAKSE